MRLLELTDADNPQYDQIKEGHRPQHVVSLLLAWCHFSYVAAALTRIKSIAQHLNEHKRLTESAVKTAAIERRVKGLPSNIRLVQSNRIFIRTPRFTKLYAPANDTELQVRVP